MRYQGGKSKIAKDIVSIIERERESNLDALVSLFCGSCSIESKVNIQKKFCNDKHPYLIAMWQGLQNGWIPPTRITSEEYKYIREHKDENPALTGFVGFGCSFGGKWFGGLARNKKGDNYCERAERSLLKDFDGLRNATFTCLDYKDVPIPEGAIVYADPPYKNTTGYSLGGFNHEEFWEYMRELSKDHIVLISEQNAPDDFEIVWEKEQKRMLDVNKDNIFTITEKLFKWKG